MNHLLTSRRVARPEAHGHHHVSTAQVTPREGHNNSPHHHRVVVNAKHPDHDGDPRPDSISFVQQLRTARAAAMRNLAAPRARSF